MTKLGKIISHIILPVLFIQDVSGNYRLKQEIFRKEILALVVANLTNNLRQTLITLNKTSCFILFRYEIVENFLLFAEESLYFGLILITYKSILFIIYYHFVHRVQFLQFQALSFCGSNPPYIFELFAGLVIFYV